MPHCVRAVSLFGVLVAFLCLPILAADTDPGAALYAKNCATCHDAGASKRVPPKSALQQLTPAAIVQTLTSGVMKQQGSALTQEERVEVAKWLGSAASPQSTGSVASASCESVAPATAGGKQKTSAGDWVNWGNGDANWRYQPQPGLSAADVPRLKLKWAYGVAGVKMMRSQPIVYRGRIYVGADNGTVVALDARTGCTYWTAKFKNVRSGMSLGRAGDTDALFFGDVAATVYAVDLATGKELWHTRVSSHRAALATGTPVYFDGKVFAPASSYEEVLATVPNYECCSFRGQLTALDAATGKVLWETYTIPEAATSRGTSKDNKKVAGPSGAALWSAPTIDAAHHVVYVATGDNYSDPATTTSDSLMAIDINTGKILWSKQFTKDDVFNLACGDPGKGSCSKGNGPDLDFGSSPIVVTLRSGKQVILMAQKSGVIYAVDPASDAKILWEQRVGHGGPLGGIQWGPATDGKTVFVALSDIAFREKPVPPDGVLDTKSGGGISAFSVDSGALVWKAPPPDCGTRKVCSPAQSAAVTAIPGVVFSGSLDGHLRAYSAATGKVVWDFDTEQPFDTINHVKAEGGSLDAAGAVVAGGMVFAVSGYPQYGGKAGNVLLAFGVE